MRFIWDEAKRRTNLGKHGLDLARADAVFAGPTFTFPDERFPYGERRFVTVGLLNGGVVVIAHTETDAEIRVISMRKADRHEQTIFFENL